jgi:hypothetical protein
MTGREFPYQVTRIGSVGSKYFTPVRCCRCGREKVFESVKALPDEVIAKRFRAWGWVIGRNRNHDICPVCIGVKPENKLADRFKVTVDDVPVPSRAEVAEQAQAKQEATQKSIQAGLLKMKIYKDISTDLKGIRESLEKMTEAFTLVSVAVLEREEAAKQKAPAKKARAVAKKPVKRLPLELVSKG